MKNPSISKQSGGVDISLKAKRVFYLKLLLAGILVPLVCYALNYFADVFLNGVFVDWFSHQFVYEQTIYNEEGGLAYVEQSIDWKALKAFLGKASLLFAWIFVFSLIGAFHLGGKRRAQKVIKEAGEKLHQYMHSELEAEEIFPPEYAQISTRMVQIKADIEKKEQSLKDEARKKSDLIAYLAHDLKTPLTSVLGYLTLLKEAPDMSAVQREKYVHIACDKAERLDSLIEEFFEITRYNLQEMILEKEELDVSYMMMQMTEEFYPLLSAKNNTVRLEPPQELTVYADPQKLARVFNNLLKNAIAYSYPDTEIVVRGEQQENQVVISFEDYGKTIPRQKLDLIFQKFFRMDEARKSNTGGAGLGLAIAKEIAELHGGTITAESQQEKTVFQVILPGKS